MTDRKSGVAGKRVVGVGGIFLRSKQPKELSNWYSKHLGIRSKDNVAIFAWKTGQRKSSTGYTVWSIFPGDTSYFHSKTQQVMINYRVKNLKKVLTQLRREGVKVDRKVEDMEYGKFGWITDPEGNRIELWEPPKTYRAPEPAIAME